MITPTGLKTYCQMMYDAAPVYLWGADMQVITPALIDELTKKYGKAKYKREKLLGYEGRLGGDCSGFLTPVSGVNMTAANYYSKCLIKGTIDGLADNKVALVFIYSKVGFGHVGVYTGDGYTYEMYNRCDRKKINRERWTHFGIPSWLDYSGMTQAETVTLNKALKGYMSAVEALNETNPKTVVASGTYYVYNRKNGAVNVTKTVGQPGSWVVM